MATNVDRHSILVDEFGRSQCRGVISGFEAIIWEPLYTCIGFKTTEIRFDECSFLAYGNS